MIIPTRFAQVSGGVHLFPYYLMWNDVFICNIDTIALDDVTMEHASSR